MRPNWPNYPGAYPQPPFPQPPKCPPFDNCISIQQQIRWLYERIQELATGQGLTLDDTVTQDSANGVKSSGIWTYGEGIRSDLNTAIDGLDTEVTQNTQDINNLQKSQTSLTNRVQSVETDLTAAEETLMDVTGDVSSLEADVAAIHTKDTEQDARLTSLEQQEIILDDTVTQDSANGVKSSGIWTYGEGIRSDAADAVEALDNKTSEAILTLGDRVQVTEENIDRLDNEMLEKQDVLHYDSEPLLGSMNPVSSDGLAQLKYRTWFASIFTGWNGLLGISYVFTNPGSTPVMELVTIDFVSGSATWDVGRDAGSGLEDIGDNTIEITPLKPVYFPQRYASPINPRTAYSLLKVKLDVATGSGAQVVNDTYILPVLFSFAPLQVDNYVYYGVKKIHIKIPTDIIDVFTMTTGAWCDIILSTL